MATDVPSRAQIVVVGGGVIGCSIAYHLTKLGVRDVLLLERHELTSGTTWHAAGLITSAGFRTETSLWIARYSRDLYERLEMETGHSTGFKPVGHLHLACDRDHAESITRERDFQIGFGVPNELISAQEVAELFPLARTDDVVLAAYVADEGRADPVGVTTSLAKGAEIGGATIIRGVTVTGFVRSGRRVCGVVTDRGVVECESVVLAAGLWSRQLAASARVELPLQAAEHYYVITEPIPGVHQDLPVVEDPAAYGYIREEGGGLLVGLFEPEGKAWQPERAPEDFAFGAIPPDYDRVSPFLEQAMRRVPGAADAGIKLFFCGPESFTPDVSPMLGPAPELDGLWVAAGMNSLGVLSGGGIGSVLASWMVDGVAPLDMSPYTIERASTFEGTLRFREERTAEQLGVVFGDGIPPTFRWKTARGIRRSPLHEVWARQDAHFSVSHGWEYVEWFGHAGSADLPYTWGRGPWTENVALEHRAVRETVGLLDMSFMSKFLVQGPDAVRVVDRLSAGDVAGAVGRVVYTQWLNVAGGIDADLTVTRLAEDQFLIVVSDVSHRRVAKLLNTETRPGELATVTDVTAGYAILSLQGPRSRELLQRVSPDDLTEAAFPYMTCQEIEVGYSRVLALRVTYVGELGFELYVPSDQAVSLGHVLQSAGAGLGLRPVGLTAMGGLRLEKGYRDYGVDIDNTDTPISAGLAFAVAWDKATEFRGRAAVMAARGDATERLVSVLVEEPEPLLYGSEPVHRDGLRVGHVQAGGYGFTLGGAVGLASVTNAGGVSQEWLDSGTWEVIVNGVAHRLRPSLKPLYDPDRTKVTGLTAE